MARSPNGDMREFVATTKARPFFVPGMGQKVGKCGKISENLRKKSGKKWKTCGKISEHYGKIWENHLSMEVRSNKAIHPIHNSLIIMILSKTYQDIPSDNQIWQRKIPDQNLSLHRKKTCTNDGFWIPTFDCRMVYIDIATQKKIDAQ